jgi:hypothetical protein
MNSFPPYPIPATCFAHFIPQLGGFNYTLWRVQITMLCVLQFSPPAWHFIPLQSKYSPQHPVPPLMSETNFPLYRTPGKMSLVHASFYILKQQIRRKKVLDWMVASITRIRSPLNFLQNQIFAVQKASNLNFSRVNKWKLRCVLKWSCVGDMPEFFPARRKRQSA